MSDNIANTSVIMIDISSSPLINEDAIDEEDEILPITIEEERRIHEETKARIQDLIKRRKATEDYMNKNFFTEKALLSLCPHRNADGSTHVVRNPKFMGMSYDELNSALPELNELEEQGYADAMIGHPHEDIYEWKKNRIYLKQRNNNNTNHSQGKL